MVPKERSVLLTSTSMLLFCFLSSAEESCFNSTVSSLVFSSSKSYTCFGSNVTFSFGPANGLFKILERSISFSRSVKSSLTRRRSLLPTISSMVRQPNFAMISLNSSAINRMKFSTYSGFPAKRFRSSGFCVAIPAGQVSRLHTRIITHPMVTSGAVANPYSSAPSNAAIATSRPLISLPSVSILTLLRSPFIIRVWCVSASPSSQGSPALWIELLGAAPVPPSYPEINTTCAPALATPAATVPTPASDTSFTEILASRLAFFKS